MAIADLTDRIKFIDRKARAQGTIALEAQEQQVEQEMMTVLDNSEAVVPTEMQADIISRTAYYPPEKPEVSALTEEEVPQWAKDLQTSFDELKAEIAKMNKHINSIQKFIKKAS